MGNLLWEKVYGTAGTEYFYGAIQTFDGGFAMVGSTDTSNNSIADAYVVKVDAGGNLQWSKSFSGNSYENFSSVFQTTDSGYVITGMTRSFGAGNDDCLLMKLDKTGNLLWAKTYGGPSVDDGLCVIQTADGGFAIAGETISFGSGLYDSFFNKTDSAGNLQWSKTYGGSANYEYSMTFIQTADHGYALAGASGSFGMGDYDGYLVKTDSLGSVEWSRTYGTVDNDNLHSVYQTLDGGYLLTYRSYSFTTGTWNGSLIRTDSTGDVRWTKTYGGNGFNQCCSASQTSDSGCIVIGNTFSFGAGGGDIYLIKTDSLGNSGCHEKIYAIYGTAPLSLATVVSPIVSVPNFITSNPVTTAMSRGVEGIECTSGISGESYTGNLIVFPNPVFRQEGHVTIQLRENFNVASLEIYNAFGETVSTHVLKRESKGQFTVEELSPGIYFIRVFDNEKSFSQKLIIE